jgi:hypothetical protein
MIQTRSLWTQAITVLLEEITWLEALESFYSFFVKYDQTLVDS